MKRIFSLLKAGDWLILGLATVGCLALLPIWWSGGAATKAVIRSNGRIVAELPLNHSQRYTVAGPLGLTIIETEAGRARVFSDPGPRQYCVRQGWLTHANAVAICAPNRVSLMLVGRKEAYDSLNY